MKEKINNLYADLINIHLIIIETIYIINTLEMRVKKGFYFSKILYSDVFNVMIW